MTNHEKWLKERLSGIGASEASSIVGLNPYKNNVQLWREKVGISVAEDISHKSYVQYGIKAEDHLRELFALDYPAYTVSYDQFKLVRNTDYPFIFATLDGELTCKETGRKGVLEIKTTQILNPTQYIKWRGHSIPDNYYIQLLHQLIATGYDFVKIKAQIKTQIGNNVELRTVHQHIERNEVLEDIQFLLEKEILFWECVKNKKEPSLVLPNI